MTTAEKKLAQKLLPHARRALKKAHSPYSRVKVGAALLTQTGRIFSGCNVENASYGGTICAERVAIATAVAHGNVSTRHRIRALLITTDQKSIWPPCGICRQFLSEFASPQTLVFAADSRGQISVMTFEELLPHAFDSGYLKPERVKPTGF